MPVVDRDALQTLLDSFRQVRDITALTRASRAALIVQSALDKNLTLDDDEQYAAVKTVCEIAQQLTLERIAIQFGSGTLTCVFCGHIYPPGTPASNHNLLAEHVLICPDHPASLIAQRLDAAINELQDKDDEINRLTMELEVAQKDAAAIKALSPNHETHQNLPPQSPDR